MFFVSALDTHNFLHIRLLLQEEEFPKCVQCCDGSGCNEGMPKNQLVGASFS